MITDELKLKQRIVNRMKKQIDDNAKSIGSLGFRNLFYEGKKVKSKIDNGVWEMVIPTPKNWKCKVRINGKSCAKITCQS